MLAYNRDSKNVTKEEYDLFYRANYKESDDPLGVHHFKGDAGSVSFKALLFVPSDLCALFLLLSLHAFI